MQLKFLKSFLYIIPVVIAMNSCYEDTAVEPVADFEVYLLDENQAYYVPDSFFVGDKVQFVNTGEGDHFVVWPGEKRMSFSGAFTFTTQSFEQMAQSLVPAAIIESLKFLEGQSYVRESLLSRDIFNAIGSDWDLFYTYEYQIKSAAIDPPKNDQGNDSIRFTYNHDYNDFILSKELAYYNVTGFSLSEDINGLFTREFIYSIPGKFNVHLISTGVGDYGANVLRDISTKEVIVYAR